MLDAALKALKNGKVILLLDDASREPASFLVASAKDATKDLICQMVNSGGGVICVALYEETLKTLGLSMMNPGSRGSSMDFAVSVESREGVSTGISASDRAKTVRALATTSDPKKDLVMPGHVFPVRAKTGGVLVRSAPAEAASDLLALAGLEPKAVLCHNLDSRGELLNSEETEKHAKKENIPLVRISEVITERLKTEPVLERVAKAKLPLKGAEGFSAVCFRSKIDSAEHFALVKGDLREPGALVRVQAENRLGDLLGFGEQPSRLALANSIKKIDEEGRGLLVYIRHPGKGLLSRRLAKLDSGEPVSRANQLRELGIGAQILADFKLKKIRLLTNSERDFKALGTYNIEIDSKVTF